jgi:ATP citrate (pro-S)-lyase
MICSLSHVQSGGLSNEMYNILAKNTDGLYEGIAIGGDSNAGSTFLDHILRFQVRN